MAKTSAQNPAIAKEEIVRPSVFSFKALLRAMRPNQWIKNLLLFAAVLFNDSLPGLSWLRNPNLAQLTPLFHAFIGFIVFCMLASGVYLLNDVRDIEGDRNHPKKRFRPIAAGLISSNTAILSALILWICAFTISIIMYEIPNGFSWKFMVLAGIYLGSQFAYSIRLKNVPILDVCLVASGFVIRAWAGAAAVTTFFSPWLLTCTGLLSLLLAFGKRRHEILLLGENSGGHRTVLGQYTLAMIDQYVTLSAAGAIVTYCVYTIESTTAIRHTHLFWSVPPVIYAVFRYMYLLQLGSKGGSPERDLFTDKHVLMSIAAWATLTFLAMKLPNTVLDGKINFHF